MVEYDTKYGKIIGIEAKSIYKTGTIENCRISRECKLNTNIGQLIPIYEDDGIRSKNNKSISFYENGNIKSIGLNKKTKIKTSIGEIMAEFIFFYENGQIKRLFPVNGKISAFWTETNEYELSDEIEIKLKTGLIKKKIVYLGFYESGEIKSIAFWNKDTLDINAPCGLIKIRIGISLYKDGALRSCEPKLPTPVKTSIGVINAFNINALGIDGDKNSLNFYEDGRIKFLYTSTDKIEVINKYGEKNVFEPGEKDSLLGEKAIDIIPFCIEFYDNKVRFNRNNGCEYSLDDNKFTITNFSTKVNSKTNGCAGDDSCGG